MSVKSAGMGWLESVGFGSTWIDLEYFWFQFRIKSVWYQFTGFLRPNFQLENYFALIIIENVLPLRFSTMFSISLFIVPYHGNPLMTDLKMSQFLILVPVICGRGFLMVLYGFILILSSVFCPKPTLISIPLLRLPDGNSQSTCPRLSMELLSWLTSSMILSSNHALPIERSFEPIVVSNQWEMFHPSAVGVCWLIRCQYGYLLRGIYPRRSGKW